ncbi:MAG: WD40 repeat domain-containing protein, partial [Planctomycetaceae bacterium]|nr:WD40 repeat domain-containing protein [Planctomycetaceae bacterium]
KEASLRNATTGEVLATFPLGSLPSQPFARDGKTIVVGAERWDEVDGQWRKQPVSKQALYGRERVILPDGKMLAIGLEFEGAWIWDGTTRRSLGKRLNDTNSPAAISPDGRCAVTCPRRDTAQLWDFATRRAIGEPVVHPGAIRAIAFSPDSKLVAIGSSDLRDERPIGRATLHDTADGKVVGSPMMHSDEVSGVKRIQFSADGQRLVTVSNYGSIRLWGRDARPLGEPIVHQGSVESAGLSRDGQLVATINANGEGQVWNAMTCKAIGQPLLKCDSLALSPTGAAVLTGDRMWRAPRGSSLGPPLVHGDMDPRILWLSFSPDGRKLASVGWISADGACLLTAHIYGKEVQVWNGRSGQRIGPPIRPEGGLSAVALSSDGQMVATAGSKIRLWSAKTGEQMPGTMDNEEAIDHLTFSPNGKWLLAVDRDRTARLWEVQTAQPVGPPLFHMARVHQAVFLGDGPLLVAGTGDGAQIWDAATSTPIGPALKPALAVAASPDGRTVAASAGREFRLWQVPQPVADEPQRIRLAIEIDSGLSLDDSGDVKVLDIDAWNLRRQQLMAEGGSPFSQSP